MLLRLISDCLRAAGLFGGEAQAAWATAPLFRLAHALLLRLSLEARLSAEVKRQGLKKAQEALDTGKGLEDQAHKVLVNYVTRKSR